MHIYIRKTPADHLLSSVATQGCSHTPQAVFLYLHLRRTPCHIRVFGRPSSRRLRLHSPVDRGGNGNTPCMRPVKRQFPRDTPLLRTAHCYAFPIRHTHTHTHTVRLPAIFQMYSSNCPWARHSIPTVVGVALYKDSHVYCVFPVLYNIHKCMWVTHTLCVYRPGLLQSISTSFPSDCLMTSGLIISTWDSTEISSAVHSVEKTKIDKIRNVFVPLWSGAVCPERDLSVECNSFISDVVVETGLCEDVLHITDFLLKSHLSI